MKHRAYRRIREAVEADRSPGPNQVERGGPPPHPRGTPETNMQRETLKVQRSTGGGSILGHWLLSVGYWTLLLLPSLRADTHYVDLNSTSPTPPYTNWAAAATVIQDAVDAAVDGDTVLVTNGVYETGGAVVHGGLTNRVAVTNSIAVRSVNGPSKTVVVGRGPLGAGACRCAYLGENATLSGFMLTNGHSHANGGYTNSVPENDGGGAYCHDSSVISNCVLVGNAATRNGGGVRRGTLSHCRLERNRAYWGGGAIWSVMHTCELLANTATNAGGGTYDCMADRSLFVSNSATWAGGAYTGMLANCELRANTAGARGGATFAGAVSNCSITANHADIAGGCYQGTLVNTTLRGNSATHGGGCVWAVLTNCDIIENRAVDAAGGAYDCTILGGSLISNRAYRGGSAYRGTLSNCIMAFNLATNRGGASLQSVLSNCTVTANEAEQGGGCYQGTVQESVLSGNRATYGGAAIWAALSDCEVIGNEATLGGGTYDCDVTGGHLTSNTAVSGGGAYTGSVAGCTFEANVARVDGGGAHGCVVSNCVLRSNDAGNDGGGCYVGTVLDSRLSSNTAKEGGGCLRAVLRRSHVVGNEAINTGGGVYACTVEGGTIVSNRARFAGGAHNGVLVDCTVEGNHATDRGGGFYGSTVSNCVIEGNQSDAEGGGCYKGKLVDSVLRGNEANLGGGSLFASLRNCVIVGNTASSGGGVYSCDVRQSSIISNTATWGGGSYEGTLSACVLQGNRAENHGGGVRRGTLSNCTLTGNSAGGEGGGAVESELRNCIVYYNRAVSGDNYFLGSLSHCCTVPLPGGAGNITNSPGLVSFSHLGDGSPCIGAGSTIHVTGRDLDDDPWATPPSIGCDEYGSSVVTGDLQVAAVVDHTNVVVGFVPRFTAIVHGRASSNVWDFGDGTSATNRLSVRHSFSSGGVYRVVLTVFNQSFPSGLSDSVEVNVASETVHYVNTASRSPMSPFTSWQTASLTIQEAVDAVQGAGALILVTNGVYATGGRVQPGYQLTNRVMIGRAITLRSVNGPRATSILGSGPLGDSAVRCVYAVGGALVEGFTLANGHTRTGGDHRAQRCGGGVRCEEGAMLRSCAITGNVANADGGGASGGTLENCSLAGNHAKVGGGATESALRNCGLSGNVASWAGGGTSRCTADNCLFTSNSAVFAGGAKEGTLRNCALSDNSAERDSGGAADATLINCTITGNSAGEHGGGASYCRLKNCILWYNTAPVAANWQEAPEGVYSYVGTQGLTDCCTTPQAPGVGNIDVDPRLASASHLSAASPCIGKGSFADSIGVDIDGELWANPPSMGCDELNASTATGTLRVAIGATATRFCIGFEADLAALIDGRLLHSRWDLGDGTVVSNRPYLSHAWSIPGTYRVVLTAFNASHVGGVSATTEVTVVEQVFHYVDANNDQPLEPYTSWETAATTIQQAIDAATVQGTAIVVTNGVYETGGRAVLDAMSNRVVLHRGVTVRSVNGPRVTIIRGAGPLGDDAVRCAYVGGNSVLDGFTLTGGFTHTFVTGSSSQTRSGGGVWCAQGGLVTNCRIEKNTASTSGGGACGGTLVNCKLSGNTSHAGGGGGAYQATLNNCVVSGNNARTSGGAMSCTLNNCALFDNAADHDGGGAGYGTLNNCTLTGNSASREGGGAFRCILRNCVLWYNSANHGNNWMNSTLLYCCTKPLPPGTGNMEEEPRLASTSHLSSQSPCIARGGTAYSVGVDIDGEPWANPPSMGCDQYHPDTMTGNVSVSIAPAFTTLATGFVADFVAGITGRTERSTWDLGDGTVISNRPYVSHAWASQGVYTVRLSAFNGDHSEGRADTIQVQVIEPPVHYVAAGSSAPLAPYASWDKAAGTIQDAVDAATVPGSLVLVTNGLYDSGGRVVHDRTLNRVAVDRPVTVRSVHGPSMTVIRGEGPLGPSAVRCAYVGSDAVLEGFTLTNGHTMTTGDYIKDQSGGGAWCERDAVLRDCIITGSASRSGGGSHGGKLNGCSLAGNSARFGGGADLGTLHNCTLSGNSADETGGGADACALNACTLSGNRADRDGGGAHESTLNGCTVFNNHAENNGGGAYAGGLNSCLLFGNYATLEGGGAYDATLNNCTLAENDTDYKGGGVADSTLKNCIVWGNTSILGPNSADCSLRYCCVQSPLSGIGNIATPPVFVDPARSNFCISASSPCVDAGANEDWMLTSSDLTGNRRIFNGTVDMGASEFTMITESRLVLQGASDPETDAMTTLLRHSGFIPFLSPHPADLHWVESVPSNITDWVLMELLTTNGLNSVASASAFLRDDGQVVDEDGLSGLRLEASPGHYHLVARHRNHLTVMSAQPVAYTNSGAVVHDFTTGPDKVLGGTNACVEISAGVWGMIAGDCDGDGKITAVDRAIVSNQVGRTGYLPGDCNLDGVVTEEDVP